MLQYLGQNINFGKFDNIEDSFIDNILAFHSWNAEATMENHVQNKQLVT